MPSNKEKNLQVTGTTNKKLSSIKVLYIVLFLLAIGVIILSVAGIFESPRLTGNIANQNNSSAQQNNPHASADMNSLKQIKDLEEHLKSNPTDFEAMLQLGHLLNDSGFLEKAIEYYSEYLKNNPKAADVWVDMGVCYFNKNDFDNAIINMEKGLEINPNHQIACLNLGIVNFSAGNKEKADFYWNKAISLNPNNEVGVKAKQLLNSK